MNKESIPQVLSLGKQFYIFTDQLPKSAQIGEVIKSSKGFFRIKEKKNMLEQYYLSYYLLEQVYLEEINGKYDYLAK